MAQLHLTSLMLAVLVPSVTLAQAKSNEVSRERNHRGDLTRAAPIRAPESPSPYLFVWAGDEDMQQSDFLTVFDVRPVKPHYGRIVVTLPVGVQGTMPHHTEHEMPPGHILFANGFTAGRTFLFDLQKPENPKILGSFGDVAGLSHPHSFVRLPNGNVLVTFQGHGKDNLQPGGLAELDRSGHVVRSVSSADSQFTGETLRPYSLAILPEDDRVVSSSTSMTDLTSVDRLVQVWRLSDLKLVKSLMLPPGPAGHEGENPSEPRVLSDGHTVLVPTFNCGLYLIKGLSGPEPSGEFVHAFGGKDCALPVVVGKFWIQTVPAIHGLVALDVSNPAKPVEVSRVQLGPKAFPHWLALDERGARLVVNSGDAGEHRIVIVTVNRETGKLAVDGAFRDNGTDQPGFSFEREEWPHGKTGRTVPHGAVFSRP
jgi:56kDa selenium binding protein (SBP56)